MMKGRRFVLVSAVVLLAHPVQAQEKPDKGDSGPAVHHPDRRGLTGGLAVGAGQLHIIPNDGDASISDGAGLSFRFGVGTRAGVIMALLEWVKADETSNVFLGLAYQNSFARRWFARVGGGAVRFKFDAPMGGTTTKYSGGGLLGLGFELLQLRTLALDLETTVMMSYQPDLDATMINWSVMVGAQWY